ncbi:MAG: hypothetical protein H6581_05580 [Bacteroidia bacterium]|nr:hypothetical protein [Bacteroidia bacterium]
MSDSKNISPILRSLREDMQVIGPFLRDFSRQVILDGISEYPVYVASFEPPVLGKPFFDRMTHKLNWYYNASILEEFVNKKVVNRDKVDEFMDTFGDPEERACILITLENEASFLFIPYQAEEEED